MDVTEVALSKVTDEFMAHIRAMGPDWDLDETTESWWSRPRCST